MSEERPRDTGEPATIQVRVYRNGELIHQELCESEEQATLAVQDWEDNEAVRCEIDDLSWPDRTSDPADDEPAGDLWEDYPGIADSRLECLY
jgi:hypothetical protein